MSKLTWNLSKLHFIENNSQTLFFFNKNFCYKWKDSYHIQTVFFIDFTINLSVKKSYTVILFYISHVSISYSCIGFKKLN